MIYELTFSNRKKLLIDQEDYDKLFSSETRFVKLKQGIVNPSYVLSIIPQDIPETEKQVNGYVDENTGLFVVTEEKHVPRIEDEFNRTKRLD